MRLTFERHTGTPSPAGGADASWANRAKAFGHPAVHYAWFLNFLDFVGRHASVMGPLVVFSEILIGVGLMTGVLTRWAALGGVMLNVMYVCGGSAGVNGLFIVAGVLLICAGRVAGQLGGDGVIRRWLVGQRAAKASTSIHLERFVSSMTPSPRSTENPGVA